MDIHEQVKNTLRWLGDKGEVRLSQNQVGLLSPKHPAWWLHKEAMEKGHESPFAHEVAADRFEELGDYDLADFHRKYRTIHKSMHNYGKNLAEDYYSFTANEKFQAAKKAIKGKLHDMDEIHEKAAELHDNLQNYSKPNEGGYYFQHHRMLSNANKHVFGERTGYKLSQYQGKTAAPPVSEKKQSESRSKTKPSKTPEQYEKENKEISDKFNKKLEE